MVSASKIVSSLSYFKQDTLQKTEILQKAQADLMCIAKIYKPVALFAPPKSTIPTQLSLQASLKMHRWGLDLKGFEWKLCLLSCIVRFTFCH